MIDKEIKWLDDIICDLRDGLKKKHASELRIVMKNAAYLLRPIVTRLKTKNTKAKRAKGKPIRIWFKSLRRIGQRRGAT